MGHERIKQDALGGDKISDIQCKRIEFDLCLIQYVYVIDARHHQFVRDTNDPQKLATAKFTAEAIIVSQAEYGLCMTAAFKLQFIDARFADSVLARHVLNGLMDDDVVQTLRLLLRTHLEVAVVLCEFVSIEDVFDFKTHYLNFAYMTLAQLCA